MINAIIRDTTVKSRRPEFGKQPLHMANTSI